MSGEVGVLQILFRDLTKNTVSFTVKVVGNWKFKIDGMGKVQWASILPYLWSISACWGQETLWIVQKDWLNRSEFNWNLEHFPNNYLKKEKQRWWLSKSIFHQKNFSCPFGSWGSVLSWIVASKKECLLSKILSVICWKIWSIKSPRCFLWTWNLNLQRSWMGIFFSRPHVIWVVVSNIYSFHPYWGRWSNLTNIFQMGCNHQLVVRHVFFLHQKKQSEVLKQFQKRGDLCQRFVSFLKEILFFILKRRWKTQLTFRVSQVGFVWT